jgi:multidrug efflux pump subunit AcrA (membrane-fusion protein)
MRKLALAAVALLAAPGCQKENGNSPKVETKRATVERGDIALHVTATGEIKPYKEVELKSKASGQVVRFKKEPGDKVEEGELIVELDKKVEQRNLSLAKSNLLTAEASLARVKLQVEADEKTSASELVAARADEEQKKKDLDRLKKLTGDVVSQTEMGNAELAARLAEEKARQVELALALIRGRREGDVKLAEADVLKAKVALEDAEERLRDTEIRAPMAGILLKKLVEEGTIVASGIHATTGGTPLAAVADVSKLLVEANVDETDIMKVKVGHSAEVSLLSGSSDRFKGRVELIPPQSVLDSNIIVFKVRIALEGQVFGRALVGMTASVSVLVAEKKGTLLVPSEAVRIEGRKSVVYVPEGEGSKAVPVKIGIDNGLKAEILGGLEEKAAVYVTHTSLPELKRGRSMRF